MARLTRPVVMVVAAVVAAAAAVFALVAPPASGQALAGTQWKLVSMNGQPPLAQSKPLTLAFQDASQVGGDSGCNRFGGSYTVSGGKLTMGQMSSTMRACVDSQLNQQEAAYQAALQSAAAYEIAGDQLTLKDGSGAAVLVFTRS